MMADAAAAAAVVVAVVARTTGGHGTQNACILNEIYAMYCVKCASMFSRYFSGNLASGFLFCCCWWCLRPGTVEKLCALACPFARNFFNHSKKFNYEHVSGTAAAAAAPAKAVLGGRIPILTIIERRSRSILIMRLR